MTRIIVFGVLIVMTLIFNQIGKMKDAKKRAIMNKDDFTLRHSRGTVVGTIFVALIAFGLVTLMYAFPNDTAHWGIAVLFGTMGLGSLLFAYGLMKWKIVVKDEIVTFTSWSKGVQTFKIEDVKTVEHHQTGLYIHLEDREKIEVNAVLGIDLLITLFREAGKFDYAQQQEKLDKVRNMELDEQAYAFELKSSKFIVFSYLIFSIAAMGGFIYLFLIELFIALFFLVTSMLFFGAYLHTWKWRATVDFRGITIRNTFGKTSSYPMRDITRVNVKASGTTYYLLIYIDKKRVAKIHSSIKHTDWLLERLFREQIPIYQNGRRVSDGASL